MDDNKLEAQALHNQRQRTKSTAAAKQGDSGWSASYQDVLTLRRNFEELKALVAEANSQTAALKAKSAAILESLSVKFQRAAEAALNAGMSKNALDKQQIVALTFKAARQIVAESILTDFAAALAERERLARLEEAEDWYLNRGTWKWGDERLAALRAEGAKQP